MRCLWYSLYLCYLCVEATDVVIEASNSSVGEATETQQATCHIVTEKLAATASATVTRALKGVCSTEDLQKSFMNLKTEMSNQMSLIKNMLLDINQLISDLQENSIDYVNGEKQQERSIEKWELPSSPRDAEVKQENHTIHLDKTGNKVFSYFWKVEGVREIILRTNQQGALRSPSFYVNQGYRMYIKLFPHQNGGNMYIHVGLTQGEYDETLPWPFRLKHRVMIVDQTEAGGEDITSRLWDPAVLCTTLDWQKPAKHQDNDECVGFGFSQATIFTRNYLFNNSILIKLDVSLI